MPRRVWNRQRRLHESMPSDGRIGSRVPRGLLIRMKIAVRVPCYNEAASMAKVVARFVLSVGLAVSSLLMIVCGLILDTVVRHNRERYPLYLDDFRFRYNSVSERSRLAPNRAQPHAGSRP